MKAVAIWRACSRRPANAEAGGGATGLPMLAKQAPSANIGRPMAFRHPFSAFCALLLLTGPSLAADKPLTAEAVVAQARAALTADGATLDKVKSVQMEFVAYDEAGKEINVSTLTLAVGGYRLQVTRDRGRTSESAVCCGRLEGWTTRRSDPLAKREIRAVPYEEFRKLRDMARDDLAFFALPATELGKATYQGPSEIDGRKTQAVEYAYASGFHITRHFDAATFVLVASDQLTPQGQLQRQKVEAFTTAGGIAFPAKETVFVDGKKSGVVTYDQIQVNPSLTPGLFDFPSF